MTERPQGLLWDDVEQKADLSQYYTDPRTAQRIAEWVIQAYPFAEIILEPSAGEGALIKPFLERTRARITAVELDPANVAKLENLDPRVEVIAGNFLNMELARADLVVMNPPYENDQDALFVMKAFEASSVVFALLRGVIKHGVGRWKKMWRYVDIVREANLVERPNFGGEHTPKQDFVVLELMKRNRPRERGEPQPLCSMEWW